MAIDLTRGSAGQLLATSTLHGTKTQGCRQRTASVICAQNPGQGPQVNQQEGDLLAASFLPCVHGRGPQREETCFFFFSRGVRSRLRDGIKHENLITGTLCERKTGGARKAGRAARTRCADQTPGKGRAEAGWERPTLTVSGKRWAQTWEGAARMLSQVSESLAGTLRCRRHGPPLVVSLLQTV